MAPDRPLQELLADMIALAEKSKRSDLADEIRARKWPGRPKRDGHVEHLLTQRDRMLARIRDGEGKKAVLRSVAARMGGTPDYWLRVLDRRRADVREAEKRRGTKI